MAWVKIDDQFPDHPKIVAAGSDAAWMYVVALCYSNRMMTDGFIPKNQVSRLSPEADIEVAERLVAIGLWEFRSNPDGFYIHDYLYYQPSRSQILKERTDAKHRMANHRSAEVRPNNPRTSPAPVPVPVPVSDPIAVLKQREQASSTAPNNEKRVPLSQAEKDNQARQAAARAMDRPWQKEQRRARSRS